MTPPEQYAVTQRNTSAAQGRNPIFDLLKTWAIFLVIVQHCISSLGAGMEMMNTPVGKAITMFNMPLFIFIVGYFSKSSMHRTFKEIFIRKWKTMLRPMFIFTIGLLILKILYSPSSIYGIVKATKFFIFGFLTTYWFIWIAVICVFYARAVCAMTNVRHRMLAHFISLILLLLLPRSYYIPFVVNLQAMYPFFLFGLLSSEFGIIEKLNKYRWPLIFVATAIFIWQYKGFRGPMSFYYFTPMPTNEWLSNYVVMLLSGFSGIVLSYFALYLVPNSAVSLRLSYYGQFTFLIYMIQQYFVFFFMESGLNISNVFALILISIGVYGIIIGLSQLILRNKTLALYLMGKTL